MEKNNKVHEQLIWNVDYCKRRLKYSQKELKKDEETLKQFELKQLKKQRDGLKKT